MQPPEPVCSVSLGTSGPDPAFDDLRSLRARRGDEPELIIELEPEATADEQRAAFEALFEYASGTALLVEDARNFERWAASGAVPLCLGLDEVRTLAFPGRDGAGDARTLEELREAWAALEAELRQLITWLYTAAAGRLAPSDPRAADRITLALRLLNGGEIEETDATELAIEVAFDELLPRWTRPGAQDPGPPSLPPERDGLQPFVDEDSERLDAVFEKILPRVFSPDNPKLGYRGSQHAVASEIAATLGANEPELLLVHAPTGTGKTLAYLVPAILWARRHGIRLGVATYTRALQEQAMDREVPRALDALAEVGVPTDELRISLLKGRENYLCWRACKFARPEEDAPWEEWLAFAQLATFALTDATGDLDRLRQRAALRLEASGRLLEVLRELVRQVRARSACCSHRDDRRTCGADAARWRAERSHVVITNHSFALACQEFFRHLIFDECEHLHDQAHAAWSHSLRLREVRDWIARVGGRGGRSRAGLLPRTARKLIEGSPSLDSCRAARDTLVVLETAVVRLGIEVESFVSWREAIRRERGERDDHALLREYAETETAVGLLDCVATIARAGAKLDAALCELAERLGALPSRGLTRILRGLDLARGELLEILESISAWIPLEEGTARFTPQNFHDVEIDGRGELTLAARVLLPNEALGRFYHPRLASGVFISATTWLRQGFDAARGYLGLDRAEQPLEDEERLPANVRTFRAPEVFDYSRVLVAVPRDAPPPRDKARFLEYVGNFIGRLGESSRGRVLGLFTNRDDLERVGARLEGHFRARGVPFLYQGMRGTTKEELADRFRRADSVLLGVDTFWYGADFPGTCLEHLVIVKLPYGVPDRYHHAQCAVLGSSDQRRRIYMPRSLAKFRQGFGRLMRTVNDRGCVYVLDSRLLEPRHRLFLGELPLRDELTESLDGARMVRGDTDRCLREGLEHLGLTLGGEDERPPESVVRETPPHLDIASEDVPY